jgi:8-oxo-dGTP pyrophosphatase MutT (NUDIX family)
VDPGEPPARAIVRETYEETGLRVRPVVLSAVLGGEGFRHRYPNGDEAEYMIALFECRVVGGRLGGSDGESLELRYFPAAALPPLFAPFPQDLLTTPPTRGAAFAWDEAWLAGQA